MGDTDAALVWPHSGWPCRAVTDLCSSPKWDSEHSLAHFPPSLRQRRWHRSQACIVGHATARPRAAQISPSSFLQCSIIALAAHAPAHCGGKLASRMRVSPGRPLKILMRRLPVKQLRIEFCQPLSFEHVAEFPLHCNVIVWLN